MNNPYTEQFNRECEKHGKAREELGNREGEIWDEGYQEGLAEAESRVKAREREIVEWLKNEFDWRSDKDFSRLEAWLQGKE